MSIFISYHSSRQAVMEHLAGYLERQDLVAWYAPRDIPPGAVWDSAIAEAIRDSSALLLLFCTAADSSTHVKRELALADKFHVPVYWLRLERVEPDKLGYFLSSTQWIDWMDNRDATLESLVVDLKRLGSNATELASDGGRSNEGSSVRGPVTTDWPRGLMVFDTERQAAEATARVYFGLAEKYPDSTLVLPTGRSATQVFRAMVRIAGEYGGPPFGDAHLISDTETFGVWGGHHTSRTKHVRETLIDPLADRALAPPASQLHLLSGVFGEEDPVQSAQRVIRTWPPSVHAVSMSPAGEILAYEVGTYNEPEEIAGDGARVVEVSDHGKKYIDPDQPSRSILTIGMGSALSAEVLLVLALDGQKAGILHRMVTGPVTAGVPATLLQLHFNAYVMTTSSLAQNTQLDEGLMRRMPPVEAAHWIVSQS